MQQYGSELHSLLSDAFEGWGSEAYFTWKYTAYPDYKPQADNFTIRNDAGRIVAARRVFRHQIHTPTGELLSTHIHGGTAVAEAYRGRGYYTELLEESRAQTERDADCLVTFNRAGKITTKHHKKNGWNWFRLPVYASVISPSRVFSKYMIENDTLSNTIGYLSAVDRTLTRSNLVSRSMATVADRLYGDPNRTTADGQKSALDWVYADQDSGNRSNGERSDSTVTITQSDGVPAASTVSELHELLQTQLTGKYHFSRSIERLKHCLSYPSATVFVARDADGTLIDFVVAGVLDKDGFTECRVLEQTWRRPSITRTLFDAVEAHARQQGADVVVASTANQPAAHWIPLGTEYMMWPPTGRSADLPTDPADWRVTMYDIL